MNKDYKLIGLLIPILLVLSVGLYGIPGVVGDETHSPQGINLLDTFQTFQLEDKNESSESIVFTEIFTSDRTPTQTNNQPNTPNRPNIPTPTNPTPTDPTPTNPTPTDPTPTDPEPPDNGSE